MATAPKTSNKFTNKVHNAMSDTQFEWKDISLNGKLNTTLDGTLIGESDFSTLTNFEYTDASIKSVTGMTKISTAAPTYLKHRSLFQFTKSNPQEEHFIAQSYNANENASIIQQMTQNAPSTGTFSATPIYTVASAWTANTSYSIGDKVFPTTNNGYFYECSDAGTSHATTEPTWTTTEYSSIVDNTVRWVCKKGQLDGLFSKGPDGCMFYANGEDVLVWGGDEYRCSQFINYDPSNAFFYDYTSRVGNTSVDPEEIAVLSPTAGGTDSSTELLLHFEDNVTDSSSNRFTVTALGSPSYSATGKFAKGLTLDGVNDCLTIPDDAVFDCSDGSWSIDGWLYNAALSTTETFFYHGLIATPTNDYTKITYNATGTVTLSVYAGGSPVVTLSTGAGALTASAWNHLEVDENGDDYYIFINGVLKAYTTSTYRPANYDGVVVIGAKSDYAGSPTYSDFASCVIDELRISSRYRHTGNFTPMTAVYGTDVKTYLYICSTMPISGIKFYIATPNATTCAAPTINYWNGSAWTTVGTVTDGTLAGGVSMAQTGRMTFTSTALVSKQKMLNNIMGYWYQIYWATLDDTTSVYYTTLQTPMQKAVDIWDGGGKTCVSWKKYDGTNYSDHTSNVLREDADTYYDGSSWIYPPETYFDFGSFTTIGAVYVGFLERCTGISFSLPSGQVNTNAATMTVYYWSGDAWTTVGTLDDQTMGGTGTVSLNHSGYVVWNPVDVDKEYKTAVSTSTELYYYKIVFSAALSANVKLDYVFGIGTPSNVEGFNSTVMWMNSVWLLGQKHGDKNRIKSSRTNTSCVFSGDGSIELFLGSNEEIVNGCSLFSRYLNNIEETMIVFKKDEVWVLDGSDYTNIRPYRVSSQYGLTGKNTLAVCDIGIEITPGVSRAVAIWQSSNGIMMFDNGALISISDDIENYFLNMYDTSVTERLNPNMVHRSIGFFDPFKKTYHWLFASGTSTSLNREYVYDIIRKKWFRIDRGVDKYLQNGTFVKDYLGNTYIYGSLDSGYIERLDYGNTFDGTDITSTFRLADKPLDESMYVETNIRYIKIIGICSASAGTVTLYWYGDTSSTGTSMGTVDQSQSGLRIYQRIFDVNQSKVFHSIGAVCVSNDAYHAFEPLAISLMRHNMRFQFQRRET